NKPRHFEFIAYLFARPSGLRGVLYDPREQTASPIGAARQGPRSFRLDIPLRLVGNPVNYRFAAFGFYAATPCAQHPCTDPMPHVLPLPVQDLGRPIITSAPAPYVVSTDTSPGLTAPLSFQVEDERLGTGVRSWRIVEQSVGGSVETTIASGTSASATL